MRFLKIKSVNQFELDSQERTIAHGKIIRNKKFLKQLYLEWYTNLKNLSSFKDDGNYLEIGSGSGFFKEVIPNLITSDVMLFPGVDKIVYANNIPFADNSLDAIFMVDVFHHIPDVEIFLKEVNRVLKQKGCLIMSEPWYSPWSKFIYQNFHHEPFDIHANWKLEFDGPLSSANGALPWIVFCRDRLKFETKFPNLKIEQIIYHTPVRYLLSGGVSLKQLVPNFLFRSITHLERIAASKRFSMFANIVIVKQ